METGEYVNSPANERTNGEEQREPRTGASKTYILVAVSFGLLCIVQSALNISYSLQNAECCIQSHNISTNNFTKVCAGDIEALILERNQLVQERNRLVRENEQLVQDKNQLLREKTHLIQERDGLVQERDGLVQQKDRLVQQKDKLVQDSKQLVQEKNKLVQQKDKLVQDKDKLVQDKDGLVQEKNKLVQQKDKLVQERDGLVKEKDGLVQERDKLVQEKDQLVQEKDQMVQMVSEQQNQINHLQSEQNIPCCPSGWRRHKSTCYQLSSSENTWQHAKEDCESKGSHLVILNDEAEEKVVRGFGGYVTLWMGLRGNLNWQTNDWELKLVDSSSLCYENWIVQRGDDGRNCFCAYVDFGSSCLKNWFKGACQEHHYWMCEMHPGSVA